MARLVKKTAKAPHKLGDHYICMCGLSKNQPFCDGSHHHTAKENDEKLYWYDGEVAEEIETENECECCADGQCEEGCCQEKDECCGHCHQESKSNKIQK